MTARRTGYATSTPSGTVCPDPGQPIREIGDLRSPAAESDPRPLCKGLPQEELCVSGRITVEHAKHLVAEPFIEWSSLEAVRFDGRPHRTPRPRVSLRILDEPLSVPRAA